MEVLKEEPKLSLSISEYLELQVGELENAPIKKERAILLDALTKKFPHLSNLYHIQFNDYDRIGEPAFINPILWHKRYWMQDQKRREILKRNAADREAIVNKQKTNIENTAKLINAKSKLDMEQCIWIATKMLLDGDTTLLKALGINISDISAEERAKVGLHIVVEGRKERRIL